MFGNHHTRKIIKFKRFSNDPSGKNRTIANAVISAGNLQRGIDMKKLPPKLTVEYIEVFYILEQAT